MSATPNLDKLKELNRRLTALLADPQPGFMSWQGFLHEVLTEIASFVGRNPSATELRRSR